MGEYIFSQLTDVTKNSSDDITFDSATTTTTHTVLQKPSLYQVIMLNDDFTPMGFVMDALKLFFKMNDLQAESVTMDTHAKGKGICGTYTKEVAETKLAQVVDYARANGHPLKCVMHKES
jgi:ATP-dependent Clp protease adaptor protein ClpS